jgi:hypothetical protein
MKVGYLHAVVAVRASDLKRQSQLVPIHCNSSQATLQHFGAALRGYVAAATGAAAAGLAAAGVEISLPQVSMLQSFHTSSQACSPG